MKRAGLIAALAVSLLTSPPAVAQQSSPDWQKVGDVGQLVMEIDTASHRTEGDAHQVRVRMSAPTSERSMILNFRIDCGDKTMTIEGEAELYIDGKLSEKVAPPANVAGVKPAESDGIGAIVYDQYCTGAR